MFAKFFSTLLAFLIGLFQTAGLNINPIDLSPTMKIAGQYTCADRNPDITLSVEKTSFVLGASKNEISLSGAFRELQIVSVKREDCHTLLLKTSGSMDDDYSVGYAVVSENALRAKTALNAETEIDMAYRDPGITGGIDADDIGKKAAKALITMALNKIPYVGKFASSALDSKINEILGIKKGPSIGDVLNKLEEIEKQLNGISDQINQTSQEILKNLYKTGNFGEVNSLATELSIDVSGIFNKIYKIENRPKDSNGNYIEPETEEEKILSEYIRNVKAAKILEFDNSSYTYETVKNTNLLTTYVTGNQISLSNEDNIFVKAFNYACQDSILGGEAATIISPYINEISSLLANSYKAMAIVLNAKIFVCENYNDIIKKAESSPELQAALDDLGNLGHYNISVNDDYYSDWLDLAGEESETSIVKKHNNLFSDEDDSSLASQYNQMVLDHWFCFIRKTEVTSDGINIDFVRLNNILGAVTPAELGVDTSKNCSAAGSMVKDVNTKLQSKIYKCVTSDEIDKILVHMLKNTNKVFVKKEETDGIHVSRSPRKILEDYGFVFPSVNEGKLLFTNTSSKSYDSSTFSMAGSTSTDYSASLKANGYNIEADIEYYTSLENSSEIKTESLKYYNHNSGTVQGQLCINNTTTEKCTFYYFTPEPISLTTSEQFADFLTSIAYGNTYDQEIITLETDVDFSKDSYEKIWPENLYSSSFKGSFDGNNHKITGLTDTTSNHGGGLFRTLGDGAKVYNLLFADAKITGNGEKSGFGVLAGRVTGNVTVKGIIIQSGSVTGYDKVGGIIGEITDGSLVIKDCESKVDVTSANKYAGGIIGASTGKKSQNISLCINKGNVTAVNGSGTAGIIGYIADDKADQPHIVYFCSNYGCITSKGGNTGGIIGHLDSDSVSHKVTKNTNTGDIKTESGNAGGIIGFSEGGATGSNENFKNNTNSGNVTGKHAGGILGYNEDDSIIFNGSVNSGTIFASVNAGGIAGYLGNNDKDKSYTANECENTGNITAQTGAAGGIFGHLDTDGTNQNISGNKNSGTVRSEENYAGGITGNSEGGGKFTDNENLGNITGKIAGGIIGRNEDDAITFKGSSNSGSVTATSEAGGILGYTGNRDSDHTYTFDNCINNGCIESSGSYAGGIAGNVNSDSLKHSFINCRNYETVKGHFSTGGIIGKLEGGGIFTSCSNIKPITSTSTCAGGIAGYIVDDGCKFTDCKNTADITGVESSGGITGEAGSKSEDDPFTFTNCINEGNVTSSGLNAGGIIGMLKTDSTKHSFGGCTNTGNITGKMTSGGIIGFMYGGGEIKSCKNTGSIIATDTAESYAGGMTGRIEDDKCTFTDSTNTGSVSAPKYSGNTCGYDGKTKTTY